MSGKTAQFAFIKKHSKKYPIALLVEITGVSRSGYYKWLKRNGENLQDIEDEQLYKLIKVIFDKHNGTWGRKRITLGLKEEYGMVVNEKRVRRIMKKYGLFCKIRRKKFLHQPKYHSEIPNILNRNFSAIKPGVKYSIDITYLEVKKGQQKWMYLCAIKDLYNHEIVAYSLGTNQKMKLVYDALKQLEKRGFEKGAILHSDQGTQFTNPGYQMRLKEMGLTQSMSRRGNCWDNACIENFFSHLKVEMPHFFQPESVDEIYEAVDAYIYYYNHKRIQVKLETNPVQFRMRAA